MGTRPWIPLHIPDFLADTRHLSVTETGAYVLMIFHYWMTRRALGDDETARKVSGLTRKQWRLSQHVLRPLFGAEWSHKRIDLELSKALKISEKNAANARRSHSARKATASISQDTSNINKNIKERERGSPSQDVELDEKKNGPAVEIDDGDIGTQISEQFGITFDEMAEAIKIVGDEQTVRHELRKFTDHHRSKGTYSRDWRASWRLWLARYIDRHRGEKKPPKASAAAPAAISGEVFERALVLFKKNQSTWPNQMLGPEPGMSGCRVPKELLERHGLAK